MTTKLMTIFTRTPLHVGAGSSVGAVDSPIIRERHTQFPVIPGSSIKGVLADLWNDWENKDKDGNPTRNKDGKRLFGKPEDKKIGDVASAGSLLIGEGKLLAFPVRSAKGCFAWITCPLALNRFLRDSGYAAKVPEKMDEDKVYPSASLLLDGKSVVFEEYPLTIAGPVDASVIDALKELVDDDVWKMLTDKLAIVSDEMFAYFAKNACEIAQHNRIDDATGVVTDGALFNQENVPSETLFYSVFNSKAAGDFKQLAEKLSAENNLLQIGADMTTGLGWCSVALKEVK